MKEWICAEGNITCGDNVPVGLCKIKELVRCKDCKYYDGNGTCMKIGIAFLTDEWFCADGEMG